MKPHDASTTETAGTTDPAASAVEPAAETGEVAGILSGGQESEEAPVEAPEPAQEGAVIGTPTLGTPIIGTATVGTATTTTATDPKVTTTSTTPTSVGEPESEPESEPVAAAVSAPASGEAGTETAPATGAAQATTAAATTTAAASGSGDGSTPPSGEAESDDPRRLSRPMVAAAALAGLLLVASPFVIQALTRHSDGDSSTTASAAAYEGRTGEEGFVPGVQATPDAKDAKDGKGSGPGDGKAAAPGGKGGSGTASGVDSVASGPDNAPGTDGTTKTGAEAGKTTGGGTSAKGSEPSSAASAPGSPPASSSNSSSTNATSGSSSNSASGSGTKPTVKASPATYSATAGPHCSNGSYFEVGSSSSGDDAWTTHPGGYSSGCTGVFRSLPLSGNGNDSGNSAYWQFRTGKVTKGSCTVQVHIPSDTNRKHVGGTSAYYTLHNGTTGSGSSQLTGYTINQPGHLGQWVQLPRVRITGGVLTLKLHDRGTESTSDAHIAADAAKASCTAS